jgi:adenosine kinase
MELICFSRWPSLFLFIFQSSNPQTIITTNHTITQTGKLLGIGNPLLDICVTDVDQDFLDKYEVQLDNQILADPVKHADLYNDMVKLYGDKVQYIAGGATQNSCRVAQWMLTANNMPDTVAYMGCVGPDDAYANVLAECCQKDGLLTHYMKAPTGTPTGTCAAIIQGGERALIANLGAANHFLPSHLDDPVSKEIIDSAEIYYSAGFFITASAESLLQMAQKYHEQGKTVCINLSAPFICEFFAEPLNQAITLADYVFGNENEAVAFAQKNGLDAKDIPAIALAIATLPLPADAASSKKPKTRTCIITQGCEPTVVATSDGTVTQFPVDLVAKSDIVDTNGAGDAFVGGFLSVLVQGGTVDEAIHAGHWAARYMIQTSGTTLNGPCEYQKK